MKGNKSNILWAAGTLGSMVALTLLIATLAPRQRVTDPYLARPSTYFTEGSGAKAIYQVLDTYVQGVTRYRRTLSLFVNTFPAESQATLLTLGPVVDLSADEQKILTHWLAEGGRLILADSQGWTTNLESLLQSDNLKTDSLAEHFGVGFADVEDRNYNPSLPDQVEESLAYKPELHGQDLQVSGRLVAPEAHDYQILAQTDERILALRIAVGEGDIIFIPDRHAFSNERIGDTRNGVWLTRLCLERGGPVIFNEYHLGFAEPQSTAGLMLSFLFSPWGLPITQCVVAFLLAVYAAARRFGPIHDPRQLPRHNPIAAVQAKAGFLKNAGAYDFATSAITRYLRHQLIHLRKADPFADQTHTNTRQHQRHPSVTAFKNYHESSPKDQLGEEAFTQAVQHASRIPEELTHGTS